VQAADARWRPDLITGVCHSRSAPPVHMEQADGEAGDHAVQVGAIRSRRGEPRSPTVLGQYQNF
jgi:hypothetical protein